jgi:hypothetical protein
MTEVLASPTAERIAAGTVVTDYDGDAVILGYSRDGDVELCRDNGMITAQAASLPLWTQSDQGRQDPVLRAAVIAVATDRRRLLDQHAEALNQVRAAAIEKHEDGGEVCREGLNAFLRELGLEEYEPRMRVGFTIRGSYEVDTTDDYEARTAAEDRLDVDLTAIGIADRDSLTHKVEVTNVETIGH